MNIWNERYSGDDYHFGTQPNAFLVSQQHRLKSGMSCLAVADGEGRNGVWLAQQGLQVLSVDNSTNAVAKACALAERCGVSMDIELLDLAQPQWPVQSADAGSGHRFDIVVAVFIQFAAPAARLQQFFNLKRCLKPGGLLLLQGYTPRQLEYRTGGPSAGDHLYTEALLQDAFSDMEILHLLEHDSVINEGRGHCGMSALIDMVARKADECVCADSISGL